MRAEALAEGGLQDHPRGEPHRLGPDLAAESLDTGRIGSSHVAEAHHEPRRQSGGLAWPVVL
ncbi:MAG: hypothetical protein ACK56I_00795, partial [bacterium]